MATTSNISGAFKGEQVTIDIALQDGAGSPVSSPASYTVSMVFSTTAAGDPIGDTVHAFALEDAPTANFRLTLSAADLAGFVEGTTYYYNIWSKLGSADPLLRAKGTFSLGASIELP